MEHIIDTGEKKTKHATRSGDMQRGWWVVEFIQDAIRLISLQPLFGVGSTRDVGSDRGSIQVVQARRRRRERGINNADMEKLGILK